MATHVSAPKKRSVHGSVFVRALSLVLLPHLSLLSCDAFTIPSARRSTTFRRPSTFAVASSSSSTSSSENVETQVLILGSGPAARSVASLLHASSISTILADANADRVWAPNYGSWTEEWESLTSLYSSMSVPGLEACVDTAWDVTDCYFGGSFDIPVENRLRLDRGYVRVDKDALRDVLTNGYRIVRGNHFSEGVAVNVYSPTGSIVHDADGSSIALAVADGSSVTVKAKVIVDCTGHESRLVLRENGSTPRPRPPGYQIAYGILCTVKEDDATAGCIGPYDKSAMTLFDYRTDHMPSSDTSAESQPTFMYCMPLGGNKIFFEETSLVARPAVSFQTCKDRCYARLAHLGISVEEVEEEEFCYIPMGGPLPEKRQRIVGFGGAAAMVHPSTGYSLCRVMQGAVDLANVIATELEKHPNDFDPDYAAAKAYDALWSPDNIRQRNFAVFGGEFLMKQNVQGLRGFFDGFFRLPEPLWAGFLAGWPGLPNNHHHETWYGRMWFGLLFITRLPFKVATDMFFNILSYTITDWDTLPQSVTPFLGEPESYVKTTPKRQDVGDVAAKLEAKQMIRDSQVSKLVPVAFGQADEDNVDPVGTDDTKKEEEDANIPEESFQ